VDSLSIQQRRSAFIFNIYLGSSDSTLSRDFKVLLRGMVEETKSLQWCAGASSREQQWWKREKRRLPAQGRRMCRVVWAKM
jgi:hypothetical protein